MQNRKKNPRSINDTKSARCRDKKVIARCTVIGNMFSFLYHIRDILNNTKMNACVMQGKRMSHDECITAQFQLFLPLHANTYARILLFPSTGATTRGSSGFLPSAKFPVHACLPLCLQEPQTPCPAENIQHALAVRCLSEPQRTESWIFNGLPHQMTTVVTGVFGATCKPLQGSKGHQGLRLM